MGYGRLIAALIMVASFAFSVAALAGPCDGQFPAGDVCGNSNSSQAFPGAASLSSIFAVAPSGTIAVTDAQRPITSAYTLGQSGNNDCGVRIVAAGGTFYAISANSPSTYTCGTGGNFFVEITNDDPTPTGSNSTGAKFVNFATCLPGLTGTYLWPQQTMRVAVINNAWVPVKCPGLFELPEDGTFTFNYDTILGTDPVGGGTWGAADGLSTGTRAFKSAFHTLLFSLYELKANTAIQILGQASGDDPVQIHWAPHADISGTQGGAAVTVDCNGGSLTANPGIQLYYGAILSIQNCAIPYGVSINAGAKMLLTGSSNTFTPVSGGWIFTLGAGRQLFNNNGTVNLAAGSGAGLLDAEGGANAPMPAINQTGNVTWSTATVFESSGSFASFANGWTTNGFSTTGSQYDLIECSILEGTSHVPGSGTTASCTQAN